MVDDEGDTARFGRPEHAVNRTNATTTRHRTLMRDLTLNTDIRFQDYALDPSVKVDDKRCPLHTDHPHMIVLVAP
jgi:hypothetical protein